MESVYFDGGAGREIPYKAWTKEMIAHAGMRENTVQREPKSVRYTIFGKALFTFLLILILVIGFMVVQRVAEVKKANAQHTLSNPTSK